MKIAPTVTALDWINVKNGMPSHKDLVLCKHKDGMVVPAIYYDNNSFNGFYPFTTYYKSYYHKGYYSQVKLVPQFMDIIEWTPMPQ